MFKHFITHKRGETDEDIQDSIAFDLSRGRYAISDGVTQSFLPQLWSALLVNHYISSREEKLYVSDLLLNEFEKAKKKYLQNLDEDVRFIQDLVEQEFKHAAATFAGVQVKNHDVFWQVIGDSCIFIIPTVGPIKCICSNTSSIDSEGHIKMSFDNHPDYIISDGTVKGVFLEGVDSLDSGGWIVLMTDAISDWFIKEYNQGNNPLVRLLELENNTDFEKLIDKECNLGRMKSDDVSVILFNVAGDDFDKNHNEPIVNNEIDYYEGWYEQTLPLWMI